jgi:hypothetical protein
MLFKGSFSYPYMFIAHLLQEYKDQPAGGDEDDMRTCGANRPSVALYFWLSTRQDMKRYLHGMKRSGFQTNGSAFDPLDEDYIPATKITYTGE